MDTKTCTKCKLTKSEEAFSYRNQVKNKRCEQCKDCINTYAKQYRKQNVVLIQDNQKTWYENRGKEWKRQYETAKKEHINLHARERYQHDIDYRIKKVLRSRMHKIMHSTNEESTLNLLNVSVDYFKKWLEFQWTPEMSWENYGIYWDIDHVKPCSSFDLKDEQQVRECFHWSNMQPLEKRKNYIKNNKVDSSLIQKHKSKSDAFVSINPVPSLCRNI